MQIDLCVTSRPRPPRHQASAQNRETAGDHFSERMRRGRIRTRMAARAAPDDPGNGAFSGRRSRAHGPAPVGAPEGSDRGQIPRDCLAMPTASAASAVIRL